MQKTFLDFFAGSGLVSYALAPWFKATWANDISNDKFQVYAANLPAGHFHLGPIERIRGTDVPEADLSWGSFPCQDLSLAGKAEGLAGSRSGLFRQWIRVMGEMPRRPPVAVAENVVGLLSLDDGRHYLEVHEALVSLGYRVGALVLDAARWIPQSRKRVFVVAARSDLTTPSLWSEGPLWCHPAIVRNVARKAPGWTWWALPEPPPSALSLKDVIDFSQPCDPPAKTRHLLDILSENHRKILDDALTSGTRRVFPGYRRTRNHRQTLEIRDDGIAGCLRTPRGGSSRQTLLLVENGLVRSRLLTARETAALMGAPAYTLPARYNDAYLAMGDAVAVPVARWLADKLLAPLAEAAGGTK